MKFSLVHIHIVIYLFISDFNEFSCYRIYFFVLFQKYTPKTEKDKYPEPEKPNTRNKKKIAQFTHIWKNWRGSHTKRENDDDVEKKHRLHAKATNIVLDCEHCTSCCVNGNSKHKIRRKQSLEHRQISYWIKCLMRFLEQCFCYFRNFYFFIFYVSFGFISSFLPFFVYFVMYKEQFSEYVWRFLIIIWFKRKIINEVFSSFFFLHSY